MKRDEVKVLVVEDEEIIRMMFKQSFSNWGFKVDTAENGKDALEKCQKQFYNIVVTDLNMPVMDGMDLLKRLKSKFAHQEVIVITGYATIESAIEAMKLGAYDFILKPVNFDHVQFTINKCFTKIRAEAENEELRELNSQLLELNEMKDKFLYITNHEIRTPLTIIKGYIDVLSNLIINPNSEVTETLTILEDTVAELSELVDRMHLLKSLELGETPKNNNTLDLKEILGKVYRDMANLFKVRNIELRIVVDKKPLFIKGDYRQVRLIMRELLNNALKFTPDGGKVMVKLEIKNDQILYSVKDTGVGIPYDKQNVIFDRFYEIQDVVNHRSSKKDFMGGGLGIGLSMVKEIVEGMDGRIELLSEPGQGSVFKLVLPYSQTKSKTATVDKTIVDTKA
ncbi:MAG: hybrid sensor histidine kinase/response regulator [Calditrichaeota bacterium]|nr:hybrid sensor histidine kinase/response regulator [Calditrichota bacterium]RQV92559.1 MAG: hybrid sensor histidine kinase/response regulator [bacterium]RQV99633.1 MAG: hybrid sensor histidine kinase/response regulator [Calditrichota bacterium]